MKMCLARVVPILATLFGCVVQIPCVFGYDHSAADRLEGIFRDQYQQVKVEPNWLSPNEFWYERPRAKEGPEFVLVDCWDGSTEVLASRDELPDETQKPWQPNSRQEHARATASSPDGKWEVSLRDYNLWLLNLDSDEESKITTDGKDGHSYHDRVFWSPDSTRFVAMQTKAGGDRRVYLIESSPKDQLQPKLDSYHYLKPGDPIEQRRPRLFSVEDKREIEVDCQLFHNPWSIGELRWDPNGQYFTFYYNQRGHQVARVLKVDASSGEVRAVVDEQQPTFIDYANKHFAYYLDKSKQLIWMSERDGWNHLYLIDMETGKVKNQITTGDWVIRGVDHVDAAKQEIWFRSGGIRPEQDPYYIHHCRINFDGSGLVVMTEGDGTHDVTYSPERDYLIDRYSRVDLPPVTELRRTKDGEVIATLETTDIDELLAAGWPTPERFVAKGRDGQTDIHGVIYRPTDFDHDRLYPIVEDLYAGPHSSFVPKSFSLVSSFQKLAELGFVVVKIDGMGTSHRSKAFHDVCCKNIMDAGLPDRKKWIKRAAAKYPQLDVSRVGVIGHSAGAQSAMAALLWHHDFYKVAIAGCGCHDNRMDKIWWNELWMGWPIGPHYEEQSNVTNAHRLEGQLLLIVGELDRNVDPASTMQVVDALMKADKDFELIVVPGRGHGTDTPYVVRRKRDFLIEHLKSTEIYPLESPDVGRKGYQSVY